MPPLMRGKLLLQWPRSPWARLPTEIRYMILNQLTQQGPGWGKYASVCREWQAVIEPLSFRQLKLRVADLDAFGQLVRPCARALVRHVWLQIELRRYICIDCCLPEPSWRREANHETINDALYHLFAILSTWGGAGEPPPAAHGREGLTLELSMYSPSDARHFFRNFYFEDRLEADGSSSSDSRSSTGGTLIPGLGSTVAPERRLHDPRHGWFDGRQAFPPSGLALYNVHSWIYVKAGLPEVHCVTRFVIRRQVRRRLQDVGRILMKLPRLQSVVFEPWRDWETLEQMVAYSNYVFVLTLHMPKTVTRVSFFEDFYASHKAPVNAICTSNRVIQHLDIPLTHRCLSRAFAKTSLRMQHLSAAHVIDASLFFHEAGPDWMWNKLETLALTSKTLLPKNTDANLVGFMRDAAAKVAGQMPRLHTLVIWTYWEEQQHAAAFIYQRHITCCSVTWRGTWVPEDWPRVVRLWDVVSIELTGEGVRDEAVSIDSGDICSHGDAIAELKLPVEVADATSVWQMQNEAVCMI